MKERLKKLYSEVFGGGKDPRCFFAPGRVNLIGEHTDYNGGHVFPCALSMGIYCAAAPREDGLIRLWSAAFPDEGVSECRLEELLCCKGAEDMKALAIGSRAKRSGWTVYPLGSLKSLADAGYSLPGGLDMVFDADLPTGSGLSSSAAMEVLALTAASALWGIELEGPEKALIAQAAENRYAGVPCGIMDQFASAMGKKDHAIFLDTQTLEYELVPLDLANSKIVIVNSMVKHSLASSAYAERRRECAEALEDIQKEVNAASLGALDEESFERAAQLIHDPVCRKRARHAVYENRRAVKAAELLRNGNIKGFGALMNASHASLRDDFEVSCPELDLLAETAQTLPGVLGARMTGGGFGGCTVNIVELSALDAFREAISSKYIEAFGKECLIYTADPSDGAGEL